MHKNASPRNGVHQDPAGLSESNSVAVQEKEVLRADQNREEGIERRDFIKRTGMAVAGLTAASTFFICQTRTRGGIQAG